MHQELLALLATGQKQNLRFQQVMDTIRRHYECTPVPFTVDVSGKAPVHNPSGTNVASSQLLAFARRIGLDEQATLHLYAEHYEAVLADPAGTAHANIRAFMAGGWEGVEFGGDPLRLRGPG